MFKLKRGQQQATPDDEQLLRTFSQIASDAQASKAADVFQPLLDHAEDLDTLESGARPVSAPRRRHARSIQRLAQTVTEFADEGAMCPMLFCLVPLIILALSSARRGTVHSSLKGTISVSTSVYLVSATGGGKSVALNKVHASTRNITRPHVKDEIFRKSKAHLAKRRRVSSAEMDACDDVDEGAMEGGVVQGR